MYQLVILKETQCTLVTGGVPPEMTECKLVALNKKDYEMLRKVAQRSKDIPETYTLQALDCMIGYLGYMSQTRGIMWTYVTKVGAT